MYGSPSSLAAISVLRISVKRGYGENECFSLAASDSGRTSNGKVEAGIVALENVAGRWCFSVPEYYSHVLAKSKILVPCLF